MEESGRKHDSRQISPHEEVHLIQGPDKMWTISSIDITWVQGPYAWPEGTPLPVPVGFNWTKVYVQQLGWDNREYDTPDQAYAYVEKQLRAGKVPWRAEVIVECDWRGQPV